MATQTLLTDVQIKNINRLQNATYLQFYTGISGLEYVGTINGYIKEFDKKAVELLISTNAPGTITALVIDTALGYTPYDSANPANYISTISGISAGGDLFGTYPNPTLKDTGTSGNYNNINTDSKGRVISGSLVSYLIGNQTITLTGNVTGSGTTAITTTIANLAVTNAMIAASTIDLTAKVMGLLPLANGGTNALLTASNGGILYSTASALAVLAAGTSGQILISGGAGSPTWSGYSVKQMLFTDPSTAGKVNGDASLLYDSTNGMVTTKPYVNSASAASGVAGVLFSGGIFGGTGVTSLPLVLIQTTGTTSNAHWDANGTFLGINSNSSGSSLIGLYFQGTQLMKISTTSTVLTFNGQITTNWNVPANASFTFNSLGTLAPITFLNSVGNNIGAGSGGNFNSFVFTTTFNATSGGGSNSAAAIYINPTFNQTSGSGTFRGLFIDPTVASGLTNIRAIETSSCATFFGNSAPFYTFSSSLLGVGFRGNATFVLPLPGSTTTITDPITTSGTFASIVGASFDGVTYKAPLAAGSPIVITDLYSVYIAGPIKSTGISTNGRKWALGLGDNLQVAGDIVNTGAINNFTTQTTVNGSTSGTAVFSQTFQGGSFKQVIIYCNVLLGTATYNFPTAFSFTPEVLSQSLGGVVTAISTSSITLTGTTTTGFITLNGY